MILPDHHRPARESLHKYGNPRLIGSVKISHPLQSNSAWSRFKFQITRRDHVLMKPTREVRAPGQVVSTSAAARLKVLCPDT